ncbi:Stk1 family PASTA domain-containing Ser/Thr kinase [Microbispora triticiradicis]|uniref:non-specific serine/threonine protein kinase n=3 Tax=Microbispora TaxID=2005 RepID=A0ABY3M6E7_9ACTN|nr:MULTISPECIES: Stk1 family PASTA domain-containing Ser/Thr kinase [Microbispora]RGA06765.1 Stk1 family PASTA domain-containing Ser/Thr kinase [Microbispora triticiradicis]TLP66478.1 Stk1 family PASTA domain-containing Ser/Thr kinase [Microbispora fusca]TYB68262.1 Stk1 family PASTA domain-containing Ser/Thr kinase [Microbispora tritici]
MTQPRLLGGRYELDGVVGRGGMAEVYRARDIRLDRVVAIKTLRSDLARDHTFQARFRREAQSAASLNHPSIIAVYDTGEDMMDNTPVPYIVMEFVDGRTLRDVLRADRRLMPERAAELVDGILRALDYSHRGGIVHRDIKPANIMLTVNGEVKVMDFGIARAMADSAATMTQTAQVIGTAQYLSPEQARGERVDARSDIYSTGCVLYELLTGQPPFTGDSPVAIAYQHVREDPIPPSRIDPEIPQWADAIVLKAMAKDPVHRYQSAAEMRGDLQRAMSGMPVDPQTMAMATQQYNSYGAPDRTRTMTTAGGAATQGTRAIPQYDYGPEERGGRYDGRRRGGGGNTALKTAAWILIPLLVIGAMIGVGYAFLGGGGSSTADKVAIPQVTNQTKAAAKQALEAKGFKVEFGPEEFNADVPKGSVISTEPAEGEEADPGSTVTVIVSKGEEKISIPDVTGLAPDEARAKLVEMGLKASVVAKASRQPQGKVFDTDPKAGEEVDKGSLVKLYVPKEMTEVPSVVGLTLADAKKAIEGAGFRVKTTERPSDVVAPGNVIDQSPQPGAKLNPGTTITLTVSSGPEQQTEEPTQPPVDDIPTADPTDDGGGVDLGDGGDDPFGNG